VTHLRASLVVVLFVTSGLPAAADTLVASLARQKNSRPMTPIRDQYAKECVPWDCTWAADNERGAYSACCEGWVCTPAANGYTVGNCLPKKKK
jgi:hypothetical protein